MSQDNAVIKQRLSGLWNLVAMRTRFGDEEPTQNVGTVGVLDYDLELGTVYARINKPGTRSDQAGVHFVYNGRAELSDVNGNSGTIVHRLESATGTQVRDLEREFKLSADGRTLVITGPGVRPNSSIDIIWRKMSQPAREQQSSIATRHTGGSIQTDLPFEAGRGPVQGSLFTPVPCN